MTLIIKKFKTGGIRDERWTYFEVNQYLEEDFKKFFRMDGSIDAAFGHMWYENEPLMKLSEIECFMIYVFMIKLYALQNRPCSELLAEVKRMVSEGILEKYRPLLPADEYQLLADDVKALQLEI